MSADDPSASRPLRHTFRVDASYNLASRVTGIGIVMGAKRKRGAGHGPILELRSEAYLGVPAGAGEKFAIFRALQIAQSMAVQRVRVQSDDNATRKKLKKDRASGSGLDGDDLHARILKLTAAFEEVTFAWVPRRKNGQAHALARRACREAAPVVLEDLCWSGDPRERTRPLATEGFQ